MELKALNQEIYEGCPQSIQHKVSCNMKTGGQRHLRPDFFLDIPGTFPVSQPTVLSHIQPSIEACSPGTRQNASRGLSLAFPAFLPQPRRQEIRHLGVESWGCLLDLWRPLPGAWGHAASSLGVSPSWKHTGGLHTEQASSSGEDPTVQVTEPSGAASPQAWPQWACTENPAECDL